MKSAEYLIGVEARVVGKSIRILSDIRYMSDFDTVSKLCIRLDSQPQSGETVIRIGSSILIN